MGSSLDNIPGPPADSFVTGMFKRFFSNNAYDFHKELLEKYGTVVKLPTLLGGKTLLVSDPKALHHIIVKDQHIYEETPVFIQTNRCLFGPGLLSSLGEEHRRQRKMLNPVFSITHLREMVHIFYPIVYKTRDVFASKTKDGAQEIDVLSWMTRTALELIGQSGFGCSFDALTEDAIPHPYVVAIRRLFSVGVKLIVPRNLLLPTLSKIGTRRFQRFVVDHFPWKPLQDHVKIVDVMHKTSVEVYEAKKKALAEGDEVVEKQIARGKDIMSILMRANRQVGEEEKLSEEELIGMLSTFTFAAMDTTSLALSRILWILSQHEDVQEKIFREISDARKAKGGGDFTYDELVNLPYLDAVCRETLRLYPPASLAMRATTQDAVLPLGTPIKGLDGKEITEILIPSGTHVLIGILASNINPEIWGPDSYEWKPERWSSLPESVTGARIPGVYSHLMTFLGGGRACIGFKFSQLEMKVILSILVESFKFSLSDKKVFWKAFGLASPALIEDPSVPRLPLMVEQR